MKHRNYILLLVISLLLFSCATEPENDYQTFQIQIEKISLQDTLTVNDTLTIKFEGYVGPNGCHSFKEFQIVKKSKQIHIKVWGQKPNFETICTEALVYLRGKEYRTIVSETGIIEIIVYQPDNSILTDSVFVKSN